MDGEPRDGKAGILAKRTGRRSSGTGNSSTDAERVLCLRYPRQQAVLACLGPLAVVAVVAFLLWSYGEFIPVPGYVSVAALAVVGAGALLVALAGFMNTTTLHISGDGLTISKGPLPWPRSRRTSLSAVSNVEVVTRRSKTWAGEPAERLGGKAYNVVLHADGQRPVVLVRHMLSFVSALRVKSRVEAHLGLEDDETGRDQTAGA